MRTRLLLVGVLLTVAGAAAADNWPAFRGGPRMGVGTGKDLPDTWGEDKNVAWKVDLPGRGWSSPVVWGDRIFVTAVVSSEEPFVAKKGLYIDNLSGKTPPGEHRWVVRCYALKDGKLLWEKEPFKGKAASTIHIKNSLASETPVMDGKCVVALFGNTGVAAYDHDGKELWKEALTAYKTSMGWGTASSPALHEGVLYLQNDNEEKSTLKALDALTGKPKWSADRDEKSNWSTPYVWKNSLRTEIVTSGASKVRSYDLDGKLLWELKGMSAPCIPTPFSDGDTLYASSGYVASFTVKPVYAIKAGAKGDISLEGKATSNDWVVWSQKQAGPYHPTPLLYEGRIYVLYDRGLLSCFDAKTGEVVYEKERLGPTMFTASPWAYGGKIFCLSEDGETVVVEAGPKFKVLHTNTLGDMTLATPAITDDSLIIRTQTKLYRVKK